MISNHLLRTRQSKDLAPQEWESLTNLTRKSFREHKVAGLRMFPCYADASQLKLFLNDCVLFILQEKDKIIAYNAVQTANQGSGKYLDLRLIAVSPEHQGQKLGQRLNQLATDYATKQQCLFMQTDTSVNAKSSCAYHHACGFQNWYYVSWPTTNYYSIVMRKELPIGKRMSRRLRYATLIKSYITTHFRYDENGRERTIYRWIQAIRKLKK